MKKKEWTCGEYYREVIRLKGQGMTGKEIAAETGTPVQYVYSAISRHRERGDVIFESKRMLRSRDELERIRRKACDMFRQGGMTIHDVAVKLGIGYDVAYRAIAGVGYQAESRTAASVAAGIEIGNRIRRLKENIKVDDQVLFYRNGEMTHGTVKEIYTNFVRVDTGNGKVNLQYFDLI